MISCVAVVELRVAVQSSCPVHRAQRGDVQSRGAQQRGGVRSVRRCRVRVAASRRLLARLRLRVPRRRRLPSRRDPTDQVTPPPTFYRDCLLTIHTRSSFRLHLSLNLVMLLLQYYRILMQIAWLLELSERRRPTARRGKYISLSLSLSTIEFRHVDCA